MKEKTLSKIVIILLAAVLAVTGALAAYVIVSNQQLEKELRSIRREIDNIETDSSGDMTAQLALLSESFMGDIETKIEEITQGISADIGTQIADQISGVENALSKYDGDIETITASLEELNESMTQVNEVITSLQEILDSIKSFLKIE